MEKIEFRMQKETVKVKRRAKLEFSTLTCQNLGTPYAYRDSVTDHAIYPY